MAKDVTRVDKYSPFTVEINLVKLKKMGVKPS